jgi:hypothetical protein
VTSFAVVGAGWRAEFFWRLAAFSTATRTRPPVERRGDRHRVAATAAWVRGDGPPPYPLVEGGQDHRVALAIEQAADSGDTVVTAPEPWA